MCRASPVAASRIAVATSAARVTKGGAKMTISASMSPSLASSSIARR
jgi:hypothetical protein